MMLAIFLLGGRAFAQCGVDVYYGLVHCVNNGEETEVDDDTCADPGPANYLCVQGYGECTDGTIYHTANAGPSESCGSGCACERSGCEIHYVCNLQDCQCEFASPILVDTTGRGFKLTSAEAGVMFDILGNGIPARIAWTAAGSGNAFLALDRNHNGVIDNGKELFGNVTEQPDSPERNGYAALAEFDKPENGGNGDGIIDRRDAVYSKLLLWIDENHDGISQPNELHTLPELGVFSISLHYTDDHHDDSYGNWFHYKAALNPSPLDGTSKDGRWTYDVFFDVSQNRPTGDATTQSSISGPRRRDRWQLPMIEARFRDGIFYEGSELGYVQSKKGKCHPRLDQYNEGGQR